MDLQKQKQISKEWHEAFGTVALKNDYDKYLHDDFTADRKLFEIRGIVIDYSKMGKLLNISPCLTS